MRRPLILCVLGLLAAGCAPSESQTAEYGSSVTTEMNKEIEKNRQQADDMPPPPNILGDGKAAEIK